MQSYRLKVLPTDRRAGWTIDFDAADSRSALEAAQVEVPLDDFELWQGPKKLLTMRHTDEDIGNRIRTTVFVA